MTYTVKTITHEYSPKEVALVTGVSTSLQRDWRRRGVIHGVSQGWNKYTLTEVIRMTVMRAFTHSGISLDTAALVSNLSVLPVYDILAEHEDVAIFSGDPISDEQMDTIRANTTRGADGNDQFTFVALPEVGQGQSTSRLNNLADAEQVMFKSGNFYGIALDHNLLAAHIAGSSPLPIIKFHVEVKAAD